MVKIKKLTIEWEKIFIKYLFIPTIYKDLLGLNNQKLQTIQFLNWQNKTEKNQEVAKKLELELHKRRHTNKQ